MIGDRSARFEEVSVVRGMGGGGGGSLFVDVGLMLVEGRVAEKQSPRGHREGPHCHPHSHSQPSTSTPPTPPQHQCSDTAFLCERASSLKKHMSLLSDNSVPMCIDVFLCPDCACGHARAAATNICSVPSANDLLLEQWTVSVVQNKGSDAIEVDGKCLLQAIRSQLHFSQLSSWYSLGMVKPVCYRLSHPGTARSLAAFSRRPVLHNFPLAKTPRGSYIKVTLKSLPRMEGVSNVSCPIHSASASPLSATVTVFKSVFAELGHCLLDPPSRVPPPPIKHVLGNWRDNRTPSPPPASPRLVRTYPRNSRQFSPNHLPAGVVLDDRLQSGCKHIGKHHCEDDSITETPPSLSHHHHLHHTLQPNHHDQLLISHNSGGEKDGPCDRTKYASWRETARGGIRSSSMLEPPSARTVIAVYRSEVSCKPCLDAVEGSCWNSGSLVGLKLNGNYGVSSADSGGSGSGESCSYSERCPGHCLRGNTNPLKRKRQQINHNSKKLLSEQSQASSSSDSSAAGVDLVNSFSSLNINSDTASQPPSQLFKTPSQAMKSGDSRVGSPIASRRPMLSISPIRSPPSSLSNSLDGNRRQVTDSSSEDTECESPVLAVPKPSAHHLLSSRHNSHHSSLSPSLLKAPALMRHSLPLLGTLEESILSGRLRPVSVVESGYTADLGASGTFCPRHLTLPVTVSFYPVLGLSAPYMGVVKLSKKGYHVPRSGTIQVTMLNPLGTVIKMFVIGYDLTDMPPSSHTFIRQRTLALPSAHLRYLIHLRFSSSKSGRVFVHTDIRMIIARQYDMDTSLEMDVESGCQLRSFTISPNNPKFSTKK